MPDTELQAAERATLRRMALSRWENEGGAGCGHLDAASTWVQAQSDVPPLTNAELVQLQIRVIAKVNLVVALLTDRVMLCGSLAMMNDLRRILGNRGLSASQQIGHSGHYLVERALADR